MFRLLQICPVGAGKCSKIPAGICVILSWSHYVLNISLIFATNRCFKIIYFTCPRLESAFSSGSLCSFWWSVVLEVPIWVLLITIMVLLLPDSLRGQSGKTYRCTQVGSWVSRHVGICLYTHLHHYLVLCIFLCIEDHDLM